MKRILILLISVLCLQVHATYYGCTYLYYANYHFTAVAYGKEVESVKVHTGVVQQKEGQNPYWDSIKDITMERQGDHFVSKAILTGSHGGGDGRPPLANLGPVAQYFVKFKDGSTHVSQVWGIAVKRSYNSSAHKDQVERETSDYDKNTDIKETFIKFRVGTGSGSCY